MAAPCASPPRCRACGAALSVSVADLGMQPLSNGFVPPGRLRAMEPTYPLHAYVCGACRLVQIEAVATPEAIFADYPYFSSYSASWLGHAQEYAARMVARLGLGPGQRVIEVASNDGYLLQYFPPFGPQVLGIEPAANVAAAAAARGIATEVAFFGRATAARLRAAGVGAELMVANNVLAHVPDLHDFLAGFALLLRPQGVVTFEFPHLLRLLAETQFDTIYHEHFSYLSLHVVCRLLARHGLRAFDVEELATHGGSLRVFACHQQADRAPAAGLGRVLAAEQEGGLERDDLGPYRDFAARVVEVKAGLLSYLLEARRTGRRVAGYGAPAKGNTLLNYCGIGPEFLPFTVDRSPHKQGLFLPGSRIPVRPVEAIAAERPDDVLILPWNLRQEIASQMGFVRAWGGRFVVPIPRVEVV